MAILTLKPNSTWFAPNVSTVTRGKITAINIVDSYTPAGAATDSWDASVDNDGSIMCYVDGTVLTLAGNGSGKIFTNEDASYMFAEFGVAASISGLNILDTSNTTDMSYMFFKSYGLLSIDVSSFNVSNVKTMEYMFGANTNNNGMKVTEIRFGTNFDMSSCENTAYMFRNCQKLTNVDITNINPLASKNFFAMFYRCYGLVDIDLSHWNTSACEDMGYMFCWDSGLKSLNLTNWDTGNVKNFESMFQECRALSNLSVAGFDTSSCEDMGFMFYGCNGLKTVDFDNWDVSNVKSFDHFMAHSNMEKYDVSKWNVTSACENLNAIFHSTRETYIDVTGWDTSNVITVNQLCDGMWYLQKIDGLETWDTSNCVCFAEMFNGCGSLKEINLSSFDTRKANTGTPISGNGDTSYGLQSMFSGCGSLQKLILSENFTRFGNGIISSGYYAYFPTPASGYWYTIDGSAYAPADVPALTAATYYASKELAKEAWVELNGRKYMSLNSLMMFHEKHNAEINAKLDELQLEASAFEEIANDEILTLFV